MHALPAADVFAATPETPDTSSAYLDRCRRVRVGPAVTLAFENRQTLWFRVQELARVARVSAPNQLKKEFDWYAGLLPAADRVRAAVWVAEPGRRPTKAVETVRKAVALGRVGLRSDDDREVVGVPCGERVADRLIGLAGWVEFRLTAADLAAGEWRPFVEAVGYVHEGEPLADAVRESLLADLEG